MSNVLNKLGKIIIPVLFFTSSIISSCSQKLINNFGYKGKKVEYKNENKNDCIINQQKYEEILKGKAIVIIDSTQQRLYINISLPTFEDLKNYNGNNIPILKINLETGPSSIKIDLDYLLNHPSCLKQYSNLPEKCIKKIEEAKKTINQQQNTIDSLLNILDSLAYQCPECQESYNQVIKLLEQNQEELQDLFKAIITGNDSTFCKSLTEPRIIKYDDGTKTVFYSKLATLLNNGPTTISYYIALCQMNNCDQKDTTINTTDSLKNSIKLYPNPAKDQITIEGLNDNYSYSCKIFTTQGELVKNINSKHPRNGFFFVDVSDLKPGKYILQVTNNWKINLAKIFIKQ